MNSSFIPVTLSPDVSAAGEEAQASYCAEPMD